MLGVHRFLHTWTKQVNRYIALTEFSRQKFIAGGLPSYKVVVKPNFVSQDPGIGSHQGGYALFVGRLSPEKGIWTLLRAWRALKDIPLKIVGHGLLQQEVEQFVRGQGLRQISVEGRRSREEVFRLMKDANVLIVPSEWYEPFGMIIIEAFSCGLPVIVAKIGGMEELVENGKTGLFFAPGDAESLAGKIRWAWEHPSEMHRMRQGARRAYEQKYTAEVNYRALMSVYENLGSDENED
jgi:glycosyltransferase involved in cell wall biosynthesis